MITYSIQPVAIALAKSVVATRARTGHIGPVSDATDRQTEITMSILETSDVPNSFELLNLRPPVSWPFFLSHWHAGMFTCLVGCLLAEKATTRPPLWWFSKDSNKIDRAELPAHNTRICVRKCTPLDASFTDRLAFDG
jgi:hypothetical protein